MTRIVILNSRAAKIWFVLDRGLTFFASHYSFITARLIFISYNTSYSMFILKKSILASLIYGLTYKKMTSLIKQQFLVAIDCYYYQMLLFIFKGICCTINEEIRDNPAVKIKLLFLRATHTSIIVTIGLMI